MNAAYYARGYLPAGHSFGGLCVYVYRPQFFTLFCKYDIHASSQGNKYGPELAAMLSLCSSSVLKSHFLRSCVGTTRASVFSLSKSSSIAFPALVDFPRYTSTMPPGDSARQEAAEISSPLAEVVGQSGRHYLIKQVLQERSNPRQRVSLAMYGYLKFPAIIVQLANYHRIVSGRRNSY